MIRNNSIHLAATLLSLAGAAAVSQTSWAEAFLGWGLSFLNQVIGFCQKRHGLHNEKDVQSYAVFSVIRLLTLLVVVFIILTFLRQGQIPFVFALLVSYTVFMAADVFWLYQSRRGIS